MFRIIAISLILFLYSNLGNAQDIPTIDDVNKNQPKLPAEQKISPSEKLELDQSQKLEKNEDQILKILVKDFKFDGNLYYSNQELEEVIKEAVNKELVYDQLINVTKRRGKLWK